MCYANDFSNAWSRFDFIVGSSSGMPIKKGVIEATGVATPIGKGKESGLKQFKPKPNYDPRTKPKSPFLT